MDKIDFVNKGQPAVNDTNLNLMQDNIENAISNVVEKGTNTNGTYIKFSDGTMICHKKISFSGVAVNIAAGSLYRSNDLTLGSFAETFESVPTVNATLVSGYAGLMSNVNGATVSSGGAVQVFRPASSTNLSYEVDVVAYGTYSQT